jgi:multidrug efflux pump subunit AcrB
VIVTYNASTVPILQLSLSGNGLTEPQLNDLALNFLRTQLVTVPGAAVPFPYGGKTRQVMVNLNPLRMQAKGLLPSNVRTALGHELLERRSWFFICLRRLWTLERSSSRSC